VPCYRCGRIQEDPPKAVPSPWARAVMHGEQVLVCPVCQREHPQWAEEAERCPNCGSVRLQIQLGHHVCRACGHDWEASDTAWTP
jgi:predicted amidophosphoribosyltransferase